MDNNKPTNLKFAIDIVDVEKDLRKHFPTQKSNFIQVGPKKYFLPQKFRKFADEMYNLEAKKSNIWTVSFPRSGCTWTQEMIWLIENNLDFENAQSINHKEKTFNFELKILPSDDLIAELLERNKDNANNLQIIKNISLSILETSNKTKKHHLIKTHLPFSLLPPNVLSSGAKIIYIARNPKDVVVSLYYFSKISKFLYFNGDFDQFCNCFMNNEVIWAPYWAHIKEGWEQRNNPNVLFIFYEEMKKDLPKCIQRVAEFLNKSFTKEEINKLNEYLQFDNLSKVPIANKEIFYKLGFFLPTDQKFIRQGKSSSNDWPREYSPELIKKFEQWMKDNMADTDLQFPEL